MQKCSYLCNMAVSIDFRRKGVATQLLSAAEELAATVMEEDAMYLHLRFVVSITLCQEAELFVEPVR